MQAVGQIPRFYKLVCFISFSGATLIGAVWGVWPIGFNGSVPVHSSWGAVSLRAFLIVAYIRSIENALFSSPCHSSKSSKRRNIPTDLPLTAVRQAEEQFIVILKKRSQGKPQVRLKLWVNVPEEHNVCLWPHQVSTVVVCNATCHKLSLCVLAWLCGNEGTPQVEVGFVFHRFAYQNTMYSFFSLYLKQRTCIKPENNIIVKIKASFIKC